MTVNNRWFQLVASLIAMIMIANLQYSWTLFVRPMRASTGWALSSLRPPSAAQDGRAANDDSPLQASALA